MFAKLPDLFSREFAIGYFIPASLYIGRPAERVRPPRLLDRTARAADHHALLLANHGPIVGGGTLEEAAGAVEALEETARLYLLLHGRETRYLRAVEIAVLRERFGP